jgi:hypothetical protein
LTKYLSPSSSSFSNSKPTTTTTYVSLTKKTQDKHTYSLTLSLSLALEILSQKHLLHSNKYNSFSAVANHQQPFGSFLGRNFAKFRPDFHLHKGFFMEKTRPKKFTRFRRIFSPNCQIFMISSSR